jgi:hypothetical protein
MKQELRDFEKIPGVNVLGFSLSVTFFPEVIQQGQSNDLYFHVVSAISDILNDNDTQLRWSVQSVGANFLVKGIEP